MKKDKVGRMNERKKQEEAQFKKDRDYYEAKLLEFKAKYEATKTVDEVYNAMKERGDLIDEINAKYPDKRLWWELRFMIWATRDWRNEAMTRVTGNPEWEETRY